MQRGEARRGLNEGGTIAYTKGTDSVTLWPVHCVCAAVMETDHTQSPFFTLICRMEIGLKSSTRGLLLVCLIRGFGPIRVLCEACWGAEGSAQEDALCFPTHKHTHQPPGRDG